jgi:hypothetical protein
MGQLFMLFTEINTVYSGGYTKHKNTLSGWNRVSWFYSRWYIYSSVPLDLEWIITPWIRKTNETTFQSQYWLTQIFPVPLILHFLPPGRAPTWLITEGKIDEGWDARRISGTGAWDSFFRVLASKRSSKLGTRRYRKRDTSWIHK